MLYLTINNHIMLWIFNNKIKSETSFELELTDDRIDNKTEYLGLISLDATLIPKYKNDEDTVSIC